MMMFIDLWYMLVFGLNCLFQEVLDEYGIVNVWQGEINFWGSMVVSIDWLVMYKEVDVICFDYGNSIDMNVLMVMLLWQVMLFVCVGCFYWVFVVWFYGVIFFMMYFVCILDNVLGGKV